MDALAGGYLVTGAVIDKAARSIRARVEEPPHARGGLRSPSRGLAWPTGWSGWSCSWERRPRLLPHRLLWRLNRLLRPAPLLRRPRPPRWRRMPWRPSAARRRSAGELWLVSKLPARGRKGQGRRHERKPSLRQARNQAGEHPHEHPGAGHGNRHRQGRRICRGSPGAQKRGAWVVSFDVTDYTGSVRVNKFFPGDEGKGIVDPGVKKATWWFRAS